MKTKERMAAPDIIKIAATIFVILIHHKINISSSTLSQYIMFFSIASALLLIVAADLFFKEKKAGSDNKRCLHALILPIFAVLSLICLRRFAVCIFLVMSGYLMSGSLDRSEHPFKQWYTLRNLTSRILRFYLPLVPVFLLALLYKIFILGKSYSLLEVIVRFFLGGFRPGGYYVAILVQLVLLFPVIHWVVRKYKFKGVLICVLFTFLYDTLATKLGMNDVLYKFLIFRLTSHIAFGVYAKYADFNKEKMRNFTMFAIGLAYAICCVHTNVYRPTIFFQWQEASFPTAFLLYPVIMWFISEFGHIKYTGSKLSGHTLTFANATYHIFLVQLLYYTTVGFAFNEYVNNAAITLWLNVVITVPLGILYFKAISPLENKITSKMRSSRGKQHGNN